jgi:hypothetical protein
VYDRGHSIQELFRGFVEVGYDALVNSFPARSKKHKAKYLDSIKYLQGRDENKKKVSEYNKQEGKIHGIQSKQKGERHRSHDSGGYLPGSPRATAY